MQQLADGHDEALPVSARAIPEHSHVQDDQGFPLRSTSHQGTSKMGTHFPR
jgi:hypothetical protein